MSAAVSTEAIVEPTPDALAIVTRELEPAEAVALSADVAGFIARIRTLTARAKTIIVTGRGQEHEEKAARVTRLAIRSERIEALKQIKELKASTLRRGRAFDGVAAIVREMTEPAEEWLEQQEKYTERADAADRDALRDARGEALRALGTDPSVYAGLGEMAEETWATILETARAARDAKVEAAKQAEAIRIEAERLAAERREADRQAAAKAEAERVERERVQAEENARLKQEAADREAAHRVEREKAAEEARAAKAAADEMVWRKEAETRKVREEAEQIARDLAAERAAAVTAEAARVAAEKRAAEDAARAEADRARAEDEARQAAALAPDREKLTAFAATLRALAIPSLTTAPGQAAAKKVASQIEKMAAWVAATGDAL